jgi:hypothetical protein
LPGNSFTAGLVRLSSAPFGSARHGTENTPLRLRLRNRGACFVVTILVWRKYATVYMLLSRHHHAGKNHSIKIANRSFENVSHLRYLGMTMTNQNVIHEKIKNRLNSGNASCLLIIYGKTQKLKYSKL